MLLRRVLRDLIGSVLGRGSPDGGGPGLFAPWAVLAAVGGSVVVGVAGGALLPAGTSGDLHAVAGLPPFRSVEIWDLGQPVDLNVHANLPQRVTLDTPTEAGIRTEVRGETLVVSGTAVAPVTVAVALPTIQRLVLWGDTRARVRAVHSQELAVTLSDSASIEAEGVVTRLELVADAHGHARLHALSADRARVTASGSSRVDVQVQSALDATVGDQAGVYYRGNPEVRQVLHRGGTVSALPGP